MSQYDIVKTSTQSDYIIRRNESSSDIEILYSFSEIYGKVHLPLTFVICLFGGVTNVLNVLVMTRRQMITPSNVLLTGMSIAQFCLAINYLSLMLHTILSENCFFNGKCIFLQPETKMSSQIFSLPALLFCD